MTKDFALKIFEAFSIERWNDLVRPFDIVEMDKSAEKMVVAYIIGKYEEHKGAKIDWEWMIYASLFDLLRKIALCDIKSPVERLLKKKYPEEFIKLNYWVLDQYKDLIDDKNLFEKFSSYIIDNSVKTNFDITRRVLRAAHKYSTLRELDMIGMVNEKQRLSAIKKEVYADIQSFLDLTGLQLFITKQKPLDFLMRVEQLRFQTRWNQTPRVPKTSVLGHCFFVAILTLLLQRENGIKLCPKRLYNNFFCGLFHDLPEAVTRDIISPVKQATHGLPSVVKDIEDQIVGKDLLPLLEDFYKEEINYFTNDEFCNKVLVDGRAKEVSFEDLNEKYNSDFFSPVDGKIVRLADHYSALLEADSSIKHGITSSHLREGEANLLKMYPSSTVINGVDVGRLFSEFS